MCKHHHGKNMELFVILESLIIPSFRLQPLSFCYFQGCYMNEMIVYYLLRLDFFTQQNNFLVCINSIFLLLSGISSCECGSQSTHSPIEGHLSCFLFGSITNKSAMNIHVYVFYEVFIYQSWMFER